MEATFQSAREGLRATGASVEERELVELLARHGSEEGALLERYQRFANEGSSEAVRYLVRLIIDDERRHHRLLAELANTIAWGWATNSPVQAVADLAPGADDRALVEETRELIRAEENDRSELRHLRKRLRPYKDTTAWSLVIGLMLADTEKHLDILRFVERQVS